MPMNISRFVTYKAAYRLKSGKAITKDNAVGGNKML
jgi:hypothetical protein